MKPHKPKRVQGQKFLSRPTTIHNVLAEFDLEQCAPKVLESIGVAERVAAGHETYFTDCFDAAKACMCIGGSTRIEGTFNESVLAAASACYAAAYFMFESENGSISRTGGSGNMQDMDSYFAGAASSAYAAAGHYAVDLTPFINSDFDRLMQTVKNNGYDDPTPVAQESFGPMWPDGQPTGWPNE